ncbi:tetratricopeptide repeat protein [Candidatus Laterigemmans baculatus]|uniref:tetratricopeptide repeat protein n=1 Tax=Candidatus Laterigemmans baculatus TaxID=2770505 RepID=UPI0013DD304C|nr:tetratricopeptide repeat protein [Candidatus Laterigemmans baculatus]
MISRCSARMFVGSLLLVGSLLSAAGCQLTAPGGLAANEGPVAAGELTAADLESDGAALASASRDDESGFSRGLQSTARILTGKRPIDRERAVALYREADAMFRRASELPREEAQEVFAEAAPIFKRAAEMNPDSALEQDALFLAGESYFFSDQLTKAEDAFVQLQKQHPRNRHSDRVASRLFAIAQYWIETAKAPNPSLMPINFTDPSRPYLDASGHGIRVLDQMRYDDPTGRLADDATMAAAVEHFRKGNYLEADQFLADLRETYPDSDHQFNAHLLGLRCKLEMYAGSAYSGLVLDEGEELIKRMRQLFPQESRSAEHGEMIAKAAAEIEFYQAEKLWERARYREKQGHYGGASYYHQELLEKYPNTPFAEQAREHLVANADRPQTPPQRLAFLAKLFPEGKPAKPLISTDGRILR